MPYNISIQNKKKKLRFFLIISFFWIFCYLIGLKKFTQLGQSQQLKQFFLSLRHVSGSFQNKTFVFSFFISLEKQKQKTKADLERKQATVREETQLSLFQLFFQVIVTTSDTLDTLLFLLLQPVIGLPPMSISYRQILIYT